jgi:hypothetical protein
LFCWLEINGLKENIGSRLFIFGVEFCKKLFSLKEAEKCFLCLYEI